MTAQDVKERFAQKIAESEKEMELNSKRSDPNPYTGMYFLGRQTAFTYALEMFKLFIGEL